MKLSDITIKCPTGPNARRESRAMAHRRGLLKGKVTLGALGTLGLGLLLAGSIFISNQTTGLRKSIADLDDRREFLEAGSGELLTKYNAATSAKANITSASAPPTTGNVKKQIHEITRNAPDSATSIAYTIVRPRLSRPARLAATRLRSPSEMRETPSQTLKP